MSELTVEAEEVKIVQQPVGIVTKSPAEDLATYARKRQQLLTKSQHYRIKWFLVLLVGHIR